MTAAAATALSAAVPAGCSDGSGGSTYAALVAQTWKHARPAESGPGVLRELVRYASLAANSHNTQPWRYRLEDTRISVLPDFTRRCPAVDPENHHLYASLGCAKENLVVAAGAFGFDSAVSIDDSAGDPGIVIELEPANAQASPLFQAIPDRQCTRATYDGKAVPGEQLKQLESIATSGDVDVRLYTDRGSLEQILEYVVAGNTAQMQDEAFVKELKDWLYFSESSAVLHRDGLFSASSGNPTAPDWLGKLVFRFA